MNVRFRSNVFAASHLLDVSSIGRGLRPRSLNGHRKRAPTQTISRTPSGPQWHSVAAVLPGWRAEPGGPPSVAVVGGAGAGKLDTLHCLLVAGADQDIGLTASGNTPLHAATKGDQVECSYSWQTQLPPSPAGMK